MKVRFSKSVTTTHYYYEEFDLLRFMNEHYPRKQPWTDEEKAKECLNRWSSGAFIQNMFADECEMIEGETRDDVGDLEIEFE